MPEALFRYTSEKGYIDYLKVFDNNLANGFYMGVELNSSKIPIYYKADLANFIMTDRDVKFTLQNYNFSYKPFNMKEKNYDSTFNISDIPLPLNFKLYFSGKINGDTIQMQRTSDLYDSKSDEMIFIKERVDH